MRKFVALVGLVLLMGLPAFAQNEYPKAEIFGGFSLLNAEVVWAGRATGYGWQASVAGNFHKNVGIVADFGGQYKKIAGVTGSAYEFGFGPRFSVRGDKATGFVHTLFGAALARGGGYSETAFGMGFGGGVDVNVTDRVAIRIVQVDWFLSKWDLGWDKKTVRFGFGIVFKAGGGS